MRTLHDDIKCPHLDKLRLSDNDLASLREQGFVSYEQRGKSIFFKLRFRSRETRRQCVRYIGKNREMAIAISRELELLQRATLQKKQLRRLEVEARRLLRETKQSVQRLLENSDYHFHGLEIRGHRKSMGENVHPWVQQTNQH